MEIESNSRLGRNMFVACEKGDTNKLLECLEIAEPDEVVFENEVTPLQVAAANGHLSVVNMLLNQGASAVLANSCGWTALHQASYYGQMEVCKALVQADPTVIYKTNYFGASAIDTAIAGGNIETIRYLEERVSEKPTESKEEVCDFEEDGSNIFCPDKLITAILCSKEVNNPEESVLWTTLNKIEENLDVGLSLVPVSKIDWTHLMFTVALSKDLTLIEAVVKLLGGGHSVDERNVLGFTALDLETFSDQPNQAVLEYLRDTSQTRLYNVAGETTDVFLEAASSGDLGLLRHLYDTGVHVRVSADVGQVDLGSRALFNAAARGHDPVVRMLVSWGVVTSATDQNGLTALDHARINEKVGTVQLLEALISGQPYPLPSPTSSKSSKGLKSMFGRLLNRFRSPFQDQEIGDSQTVATANSNSSDLDSGEEDLSGDHSTSTPTITRRTSLASSLATVSLRNSNPFLSLDSDVSELTLASTNSSVGGVALTATVGAALTCLCLEMYNQAFESQEIDMEAFVELNEEDLVEIGIESPSARQSLLQYIKLLRRR